MRASGALLRGEVESVDLDLSGGNWSSNARLSVRYSDDATGLLPRRLFVKTVNADLDDESFGDSEVTYYTRDYIDVPGAPLVRCYNAAFSREQRRYHLLLDDVSDTHVEAATRPPTLGHGLALADGLAALHARWWGTSGLAEAGAAMHDADHIRRFVAVAEPGVAHILARFTGALEPHWPAALRGLFKRVPERMIERGRDPNGFTLIHGDVGANNVLIPHGADAPVYIIDRQPFNWSLTTWLGAYDLAYAMVLDWDSETRRALEPAVLRRYHAGLLCRGVGDYTWERLADDYGLCAAICAFVAVEYCRGGVNERWTHVWLPMLQRALTACDDLGCLARWSEGGT